MSIANTGSDTWMTTAEAADRARVSPWELRRAIAAGELMAYRRGERGRWKVLVSDLDLWVAGGHTSITTRPAA